MRLFSALLVVIVPLVGGCPADPASLDRPEGPSCQEDVDCNPGVTPLCGLVRACVDQRCESLPTRTVHCP